MTRRHFDEMVESFGGRELTSVQIRENLPFLKKDTVATYVTNAVNAGRLERINPDEKTAIYREKLAGRLLQVKKVETRSVVEVALAARPVLQSCWNAL